MQESLSQRIAKRLFIDEKEVEAFLRAMAGAMDDALNAGKDVHINGIGLWKKDEESAPAFIPDDNLAQALASSLRSFDTGTEDEDASEIDESEGQQVVPTSEENMKATEAEIPFLELEEPDSRSVLLRNRTLSEYDRTLVDVDILFDEVNVELQTPQEADTLVQTPESSGESLAQEQEPFESPDTAANDLSHPDTAWTEELQEDEVPAFGDVENSAFEHNRTQLFNPPEKKEQPSYLKYIAITLTVLVITIIVYWMYISGDFNSWLPDSMQHKKSPVRYPNPRSQVLAPPTLDITDYQLENKTT